MKPNYLTNFLNVLPPNYEVCVVEAGPLTLGKPDTIINNRLNQCKSQVVLTINPYRNYTTGSGDYITSTDEVLIEMTDASTQKPFWKAIAQAPGGHVPSAYQIAKRLRDDGVITGKLPYAQ
ncbi:hypothetical protein [Fibrella aquatica]|uniref:hypothetical protein n=1 Tax=Fibrella aquatica TaxID=3242487 RepID=UPI0035221CBB